jgi:hypothetical protein
MEERASMRVRRLVAATYEPARRKWSEAKEVYRSTIFPISWYTRDARTTLDGQEQAVTYTLLQIPDSDPEEIRAGTSAVLRLSLHGTEWKIEKTSLPAMAAYASADESGAFRAILFVAAGASGPQLALRMVTSRDGGKTWSSPRRVGAGSGSSSPYNPVVYVDGATKIDAFWREDRGPNVAIRHVQSRDDGLTWESTPDLLIGGPIGGERYTRDACGSVHLVFESVAMGVPQIWHAVWKTGWSDPRVISKSLTGTHASLLADADGSVTMAFIGIPLDGSINREELWVSRWR